MSERNGTAGRATILWISGAAVLAVLLQASLFSTGLYRLTADESARSLLAAQLRWDNAITPFIWPPFYKVAVGLLLQVHHDLFLTPRVVVSVCGVLTLLALTRLAHVLFRHETVTVLTALLAAFAPQRLILSVVPLSDIFFSLFVASAAGLLLQWLRTERLRHLLLGSLCLMLAETVRYEASFIAALLGLALLDRWLRQKTLPFAALVAASILLFAFPVLWSLHSYMTYGSTEMLAVTQTQFIAAFGPDRWRATNSTLVWPYLALDLVWDPVTLLGLGLAVGLTRQDAVLRLWLLVFGGAAVLISVVMAMTFSIPMAAPFRISGAWSLLLLPFAALLIVRTASILTARWPTSLARTLALPALLAAGLLGPLARDAKLTRQGLYDWTTHTLRQEREAARAAIAALGTPPRGRVLVEATTNLDYLDIMAMSGRPELFVLDSLAPDPVEAGLYVPSSPAVRSPTDPDLAARFLTDRFDLMNGGSAPMLARHAIRAVLVRSARTRAVLSAAPSYEMLAAFPNWTLFRVQPGGGVPDHVAVGRLPQNGSTGL